VARLSAPCNLLLLSIADSGVGNERCPQAEIRKIRKVENHYYERYTGAVFAKDAPSMWFIIEVWHVEFWFSVV
jgi:hypothetical protein